MSSVNVDETYSSYPVSVSVVNLFLSFFVAGIMISPRFQRTFSFHLSTREGHHSMNVPGWKRMCVRV